MATERAPAGRSDPPRVLALVGPTAVGKTEWAIRLCQHLSGEVVSLDSRQMYRGMDIGTAKPTPAERAKARHHLIDIADPDRSSSLAEVQALAYAAIDDIAEGGGLPILAGGTGQYFRAVVEGWEIPRVPPDPDLRTALVERAGREGRAAIHAELAAVDPLSAARIDPRNLRRVVRALEVYHHAGEPISAIQGRSAPAYDFRLAGLRRERKALYRRIDQRVADMFERGLEDEVRRLIDRGYGFDLPALSAVGYREWRAYFEGEIDREEVRRQIERNTRKLVRSQGAWFSDDDPRLRWFDLDDRSTGELLEAILGWLRAKDAEG